MIDRSGDHHAVLDGEIIPHQPVQRNRNILKINLRQIAERSHIDAEQRKPRFRQVSGCLNQCAIPAENQDSFHIGRNCSRIRVSVPGIRRGACLLLDVALLSVILQILPDKLCLPAAGILLLVRNNIESVHASSPVLPRLRCALLTTSVISLSVTLPSLSFFPFTRSIRYSMLPSGPLIGENVSPFGVRPCSRA